MDLAQRRLELHQKLVDILGKPSQVYFQPPPNITMVYPAIVYDLDYIKSEHADNAPFKHDVRFLVTYIDRKPDEFGVIEKIANLPKSTFSRAYGADGLNHTAFTLYF